MDPNEEREEDMSLTELFDRNIRKLMIERSKYPPTSDVYQVLTDRINEESESLRNMKSADNEEAQKIVALRNKNAGRWQIVGNVIGNAAGAFIGGCFNRQNVKTVVGYEEEGGIVKSSATKFLK